ncbi:MAG: peptidase S10 [Beijerinckiaceae bacterium]|nr:peptidase S10 [Beijerinckiaceae bacterium]
MTVLSGSRTPTEFLPKIRLAALTFAFAAISPAAALEPHGAEPAAAPQTGSGQKDAAARRPQALSQAAPNALPAAATSFHTIEFPGRSLRFKAIAGPVRLSDAQSGTPQADIAATAFLLEGAEPAKRPVTFALNGGPGAASAWLDLGGIGPWRLPFDRALVSPSALPVTIDNADTWLDFTDLVFLDPPGTGYSRILAKGDDTRRQFYSVKGDIEALAVSIRKWLAANKRLESAKFIVGESYGGFRAPKLARRLQDDEGIGIAGLILVSPVLDFGWWSEGVNNPLNCAARLPSQTAAARGLSGPDARNALADVEAYAAGAYITDLLRGERDPQALARIAEKVAGFTGLDLVLVRKLGGRIDTATFARERSRASAKVTSLYDALIAGFDPFPHAAAGDFPDPIVDAFKTPLASAMAGLTASRLGWFVEARYEILNESVYRAWDWGGGRPPPESMSDLRRTLGLDSSLRVLVAHGVTDQVTPYFASKLLIDQVPPMGAQDRLRLKVYGGGHMFYFDDKSRAEFREDARKLIEGR